MALAEAVDRWLTANPEWTERLPAASSGLADRPSDLFVGIAPTLRNTPPRQEAEQLRAIAMRFGVAERDEQNRALGRGRRGARSGA
jgi:hypothetical protein